MLAGACLAMPGIAHGQTDAVRGELAAPGDVAALRELASCSGCPEAATEQLRLAERAFEEADVVGAIRHYEAVLAVQQITAVQRAYAYYRLAWCRFNLGDFATAQSELQRCLDLAAGTSLAQHAMRDATRIMASEPVDPTVAASRIASFTTDAALRETLARNYAVQLRSVGREADALSFESTWARRTGSH